MATRHEGGTTDPTRIKYVEDVQREQINKLRYDYEQLQRERDDLAAQVEELKAYVSKNKHVHPDGQPMWNVVCLKYLDQEILNKTPSACLAEHDARVVEELVGACRDNYEEVEDQEHLRMYDFMWQYAKQLREKGNER